MIIPCSSEEMDKMSDEEIIAAYAMIGIDREGGEAYLSVWRNPNGLIVD